MKTPLPSLINFGSKDSAFPLRKSGVGTWQNWRQHIPKFSLAHAIKKVRLVPPVKKQDWEQYFYQVYSDFSSLMLTQKNILALHPALLQKAERTSGAREAPHLRVHRDLPVPEMEKGAMGMAAAEKLAAVAFFEYTASTDSLSCSPNLYHLAEARPTNDVRNYEAFRLLFDPKNQARLTAAWASAKREASCHTLMLELPHATSTKWLKVSLQSEFTAGKLTGIIGSVQDVTECQVAALHWEQEKAILQQRIDQKAAYVATMCHEIRTPLNAIFGNAHLLLNQPAQGEALQEHLEAINFSSQTLLSLINKTLDFSKLEAGKLELEKIPFNLLHYVRGVHNSLSIKAADKDLRFTLMVDNDVPATVIGDPTRLSQILNNLLSNAIKFTAEGCVSLHIQTVYHSASACVLEFAVTDTGIGIPEGKQAAIFDSYTQQSAATHRQYGGTGLGLSITKRLVELHKGKISVESAPGRGATFRVMLPYNVLAQQEEANTSAQLRPRPERTPPPFALQAKRVLLVEDNAFNLAFTTRLLEGWKAQVEVAGNGLEAISKVSTAPFDLVLLDLHMPVMDGYQFIREMRASGMQLPIIAFTANSSEDEKREVLALGGNAYLSKPILPQELYAALTKVIY